MTTTQTLCRVCLDGNVALYYVNSEFRKLYETLANTTLNAGDGRPETLCYICISHLRRCYQFSKLCKKSEQILITLLGYGYEMTTDTIDMLNYSNGMKKKYSVNALSPTVLPPPPITQHNHVKQEIIEVMENFVEDDETVEAVELCTNEEDNVAEHTPSIKPYLSVYLNITETKQVTEEKELNIEGKELLIEGNEEIEMHFEEVETIVEGKDNESEVKQMYIEGNVVNTSEKLVIIKPNKQLTVTDNLGECTQKQPKRKPFYPCSECTETFTNKNKFASHFSRMHTIRPPKPKFIKCDKCLKTFTKRSSFRNHWRQHIHGRAHVCHICNKGFFMKVNLSRHMLMHTGERPYTCEICCRPFAQKAHLKSHMKVHVKAKKEGIKEKKEKKKSEEPIKQYRAKIKIGEKPICDFCKKEFSDLCNLKKHIKLHTGERPYPCTLCDKAYIQSGGLKSHMKSHLKVKNPTQICHICGKIFNRRRLLNMHLKIHNKNHFCNICSKAFPTQTSLNRHTYTHTREKPHSCNLCSKKFSLISTLHVHLRTHTGEKPFICDDCGRTFSQKICLIKHTRVHTGVKPYACDKCDRRFTQKNSLVHHLKSRQHRVTSS